MSLPDRPHAAAAALAACACACAVYVRPPPPQIPKPGVTADAWASALLRFVDDRGRVDFAAIREDPKDLDHQVARVSWSGPQADREQFPTKESRLAFYINAYNSIAMRHAVFSGIPPASQSKFYRRSKFTVGGETLSLDDIVEKLVRPLGDPRAHFALCRMARGSPRLPREPFLPQGLDARLDVAAREFVSDPRHVQLDAQRRVARVSAVFKWYKEDFLAAAPTLPAYINRYRDPKIPDGYKISFLPYDWTLNSQPAVSPRRPGN